MPKLLSIQCLSTGSSPKLQSKTVTPQTYSQTITADSGYDGLSSVIVNANNNSIKPSIIFISNSTLSITRESSNTRLSILTIPFYSAQTWEVKDYFLDFSFYASARESYYFGLTFQCYFKYNAQNNTTKLSIPSRPIYYRYYLYDYSSTSYQYMGCCPINCYWYDDENKINEINSNKMIIQFRIWSAISMLVEPLFNTTFNPTVYMYDIS